MIYDRGLNMHTDNDDIIGMYHKVRFLLLWASDMEPITISGSSLAPSSKGDSIIQSNQDATNETKISVALQHVDKTKTKQSLEHVDHQLMHGDSTEEISS